MTRRRDRANARSNRVLPNFSKGDYVLVSTTLSRRESKLTVKNGPVPTALLKLYLISFLLWTTFVRAPDPMFISPGCAFIAIAI